MNRTKKTVLALVIAPLVAPVIYAAISASTRPAGEGPTWLDSFCQWFAVVGIIAYGIALLIGIPTCITLRLLKRESLLAYSVCGAIVGFLYLPAMSGFRNLSPEIGAVSLFFALLGASVAATFSLIIGKLQVSQNHWRSFRESPNQSKDPAA